MQNVWAIDFKELWCYNSSSRYIVNEALAWYSQCHLFHQLHRRKSRVLAHKDRQQASRSTKIMEISWLDYAKVCWLVCPHTWWNVSSRCSMFLFIWSTDYGDKTMSLKLWCPSRSSLRSASFHHHSSSLLVWVFPVSGPTPWNSLLVDITSIDSLPVFHRSLKNNLFLHLINDCLTTHQYRKVNFCQLSG